MLKRNTGIKVLHIASGDLWAGAEVQLFTLAKALNVMPDIMLEIVLLNHGRLEQELRNHGIKVTVIDETRFSAMAILYKLVGVLREARPDVVHSHRLKENILGSIAARVAGNIPSLRTVHGAPEHPPTWRQLPKRIIYWLDWLCGRFLQQHVIAVSEDLAGLLRKKVPLEKIRIIENGIDLDTISERTTKNNTTVKQGVIKIGIAGRLVPVKRLDVFIKTAHYMIEQCPELKMEFYIYGDGPLRQPLEQLSRHLQTERAVFFAGHCDNLPEKLLGLDALLLTSDHEGLPMILLEAMAAETLIVAHAVGGIPVLLNHGDCGCLVQENEPGAYAKVIREVVMDADRRAEMVARALSRVVQFYSSLRNAQSYRELYRAMVAGR